MKGILLQPDNVKLTLAGLKTQTRREISAKNVLACTVKGGIIDYDKLIAKCKYKQGEKVFIKEPYYCEKRNDYLCPLEIIQFGGNWFYEPIENVTGKKRNALFMPHEFARCFIEIERVRVEWLHDISHSDIEREGIKIANYQDAYNAYRDLYMRVNKLSEFPNNLVYVIDYKLIEK